MKWALEKPIGRGRKKEEGSLSPLSGGCGGTDWPSFDNKDAPTLALV